MEALSTEDFLRWLAGAGIDFDPNYPDYLRLVSSREHARFWVLPSDPATWPHFAATLLEGLDRWTYGFLWPRSRIWPHFGQAQSPNDRVRDVVLRGAGIPSGWAGPIRFSEDEEDALLAVMYVYLAFGWCGDDDLFFIPDHGRQLLRTDHHDVIHAECASEERIQTLVAHMADAGYALPRELPDWTFKRPAWMEEGADPSTAADAPEA